MLIFNSEGRLGNQIFQYMFLKNIRKGKEKIFTLGFEELLDVFQIDDVFNIDSKNRWMRIFFFRVILPFFMFLSKKKIISSLSVVHDTPIPTFRRETNTYNKVIGFFTNITYVHSGFFQSEKFFNKLDAEALLIKNEYITKAEKFLNKVPAEKHKVFIHIRRGDYKTFTVYGESALLPLDYFIEKIHYFKKNNIDAFYIFLSDDPEFVEKNFIFLEQKIVSFNNKAGIDLAIMSQCHSGILSPSSFGWWGSYLMKNRECVFLPKYWLGFNSEVECPLCSIPHYATEVEIKVSKNDI